MVNITETLFKKADAPNVKTRESNIELFRIITMLLIVAHHYVVNSGLILQGGPIYTNLFSWRSVFYLVFGAWGKTGINCFVLITGYFMCKSNITLKKYAKLLLEIYFYRIIIYFAFLISGFTAFSAGGIISLILPVTNISDGFTSCYIIFFLCIPFLNILIRNMTRENHICLILLVTVVFVIIGSVPTFTVSFSYVSWFCALYIIASYIRLYPNKILDSVKIWRCASILLLIISSASVIVCSLIFSGLGISPRPFFFISDSNKILALALAVSSFLYFKNIKIKYSKFINTVASTTFGVLLIHAGGNAMRKWLWGDMLKNASMYSSPFFIIHAVCSVLIVFTVCSLIDYCRIRFIEAPFFKHCWAGIEERLSLAGKKLMQKIAPENME